MTWFKVDDGLHSHRKVRSIPRKDRAAAMGLWVLAGAWCSDGLTDGHVPAYMVSELGCSTRLAELLVKAELWRADMDGYTFHDWQQSNPTREQVQSDRDAARERMRRLRSGEHTAEVRANTQRTSPVVTPPVRDPRPDPSRSSGLGSQSPEGRTAPAASDGLDLQRIANILGTDQAWANRVVRQILERAPADVRDKQRYIEAAIRERPADYRPTPQPPGVRDLCDHGRAGSSCVDCAKEARV